MLTQVFVDPDAFPRTMVHIAIINTYLAKASEDYDTKNEEVDFNVYGIKKTGGTAKAPIYAKDVDMDDPSVKMTVKNEDIFVEGVKEDDIVLVTVAGGEIKSVFNPDRVDSTTITTFKKNDYVTADGTRYDHANTALYDVEVLEAYDNKNMKDLTYNIILDKYGYLIGLELNEDPDQYVFITGRQAGSNDLGNANADMRAIFLDGSMKVIEVNVKDSDITSDGAIANTWCTYTVDKNGIYTLDEIGDTIAGKVKVAQSVQDVTSGNGELVIDKKHVSLDGGTGYSKVYGNDNTVYLEVSLSVIGNASSFDAQTTANSTTSKYYTNDSNNTTRAAIIDDVESVTTGVKNVSLRVNHVDKAYVGEGPGTEHASEKLAMPVNEIYTLYKDNGYVIAAVVIGESDGVSSNFAYITADDYSRETYSSADDEWTWALEAVVNGVKGDLNAVDSNIKYLRDMAVSNKTGNGTTPVPEWYKVKYDSNDNVRGTEAISFAGSAGKYINAVNLVEDSVEDHDTVLMMVDYTGTAVDTGSDNNPASGITDTSFNGTDRVTIVYSGDVPTGTEQLNAIIEELKNQSHVVRVEDAVMNGDGTFDAKLVRDDGSTMVLDDADIVLATSTMDSAGLKDMIDEIGDQGATSYEFGGTVTMNATAKTITFTGAYGANGQTAIETTVGGVTHNVTLLDDIARLLGGLYRQMGVREIEFDSKTYEWDATGTLKGSNWKESGGGASLVGAIGTAATTAISGNGGTVDGLSFDMELDGVTWTIKIALDS